MFTEEVPETTGTRGMTGAKLAQKKRINQRGHIIGIASKVMSVVMGATSCTMADDFCYLSLLSAICVDCYICISPHHVTT